MPVQPPSARPSAVPCPSCSAPLVPGGASCTRCGLPLAGELAARLWQLDQELARLVAERLRVLTALRAGTVAPAGRRRQPSGQRLLLGLGVLALLVAATVFLAVAWQLVGVVGQVGAMTVVTGGAAVAAARLRRRELTATAEAVAGLSVGLAAVDALAARALGLGGLERVGGTGYAAAAALGVACLALAAGALERRLRAFPVAAVAGSATAGLLAVVALDPGPAAASWLLLALAVLAAAVGTWRTGAAGGGTALAAAAGSALLSAATGLTAAAQGPGGARIAGSGAVLLLAAGAAAGWLPARGSRAATGLGAFAACLAAAVAVTDTAAAGTGGLVTLVVAASCAAAAVAGRDHRPSTTAVRTPGFACSALGTLCLLDAGHRQLTVSLTALATAAVVTAGRARTRRRELAAAAVAVALAAVLVGIDPLPAGSQTAILLTAGLVPLLIAGWRRGRSEEVPVATGAVAALLAAAGAVPDARALAAVLASCGLAAFAYAALPRREAAAGAGVLGCSAATWVLLADARVEVVEAYTLPLAVLLLLVGVVHLHRRPDAPSWTTVGPAASAALLPSAVVAAGQPSFLRAGLVLVCGAAALVGGVAARWQSPVVTGSVAVTLVALSQLAPYAVGAPRWLTLGAVGLLLLAVGARYEQRRTDVEQSARWLTALR